MEKFEERPSKYKDRNKGLVYGVGIQDSHYITRYRSADGKELSCPYFIRWKCLLKRCYHKSKLPSYSDAVVCEEWLRFTSFKAWMERQDWEGKELDKDLLLKGNKVYAPEFCIFIPQSLNTFMTDEKANNTSGLTGASFHKEVGAWQASCNNPFSGKIEYLGCYSSAEEAHLKWKLFKYGLACKIAESYENPIKDALIKRYA